MSVQFGYRPQMSKGVPPPSIVPRSRIPAGVSVSEEQRRAELKRAHASGYEAGYRAAEAVFMTGLSYHLTGDAIMFVSGRRKSTLETIIHECSMKYGVTVEEMRSAQRSKTIVLARHEACYRGLKESGMSTTRVALALGGKDHTTIMYGAKRFASLLKAGKVVVG